MPPQDDDYDPFNRNRQNDDDFVDFRNNFNEESNPSPSTRYSRGARRPASGSAARRASAMRGNKERSPFASFDESENEEREKSDKKKRKVRVIKLVSNEMLCLGIIFAMIAVFNWLSSDYTGEYVTMNRQLGMVKLSLVRRAATVEGSLIYGHSPNLELVGKADPSKTNVRLEFATNEQWEMMGRPARKAVFLGKITSSAAIGTIVDTEGKYKVKLEKNVLASIFRQLQVHLPIIPVSRPPTFFDERQYREKSPGQVREVHR